MDDARPSRSAAGTERTPAYGTPSTPRSGSWFDRGSRFVRTFRRAIWVVADQAVICLGNFVSIYRLARFFPTADFGVFMLMFTGLNGLLAALRGEGFDHAHVLAGPSDDGGSMIRFGRS